MVFKRGKRKTDGKAAFLWLIVPVVFVALFCVYPALTAVVRSFMEWSPSKSEWIWFDNYKDLFSDSVFGSAFKNMLILVFFGMFTGNIMTLILAELLFNFAWKGTEKVYRYLFLLPALVPGMVSVLLWKNVVLSGTEEGLMNVIISWFGADTQAWYYDKGQVIFSMLLTNFPWVGGVSFLIYLSGLQAIPESVYEAADLDGLSHFKRVFVMDLPFLVGQIKYFIVIGIISGVQGYDLQLILGFSAIDTASTVPGYLLYYYTYGGGNATNYGYASAIGVVLFVLTMTITTISNKISEWRQRENGI